MSYLNVAGNFSGYPVVLHVLILPDVFVFWSSKYIVIMIFVEITIPGSNVHVVQWPQRLQSVNVRLTKDTTGWNINIVNHWPNANARRRRRRSGVVWRRGSPPPEKKIKIGSLRFSLVLSKRQIYCDKYCPVMPNLWKVQYGPGSMVAHKYTYNIVCASLLYIVELIRRDLFKLR